MKRTITCLMCAVMLLLALAACGKRDDGKVTPSPTSTATVTNSPVVNSPEVTNNARPTDNLGEDIKDGIDDNIVDPIESMMPSPEVSKAPKR